MSLEHKKRVISALVGLVGLLTIYFGLGHFGVALITVGISTASYYEFLNFSGAAAGRAKWICLGLGALLSFWLCLDVPAAVPALYIASLTLFLHGLWRVHSNDPQNLTSEFTLTQNRVLGLVYLILFPSFVPKVHALPHGPALLLLLIGIIWLGDIGAYYGGKQFGREKLSPSISPGKTKAGAVAALLVCACWAGAFGALALKHIPLWKWVLIALLSSVVAQAGDLVESLMKRAYAIKDSGGLIPGHGGVFDRFDSLILAAPFFYLLLRLAT